MSELFLCMCVCVCLSPSSVVQNMKATGTFVALILISNALLIMACDWLIDDKTEQPQNIDELFDRYDNAVRANLHRVNEWFEPKEKNRAADTCNCITHPIGNLLGYPGWHLIYFESADRFSTLVLEAINYRFIYMGEDTMRGSVTFSARTNYENGVYFRVHQLVRHTDTDWLQTDYDPTLFALATHSMLMPLFLIPVMPCTSEIVFVVEIFKNNNTDRTTMCASECLAIHFKVENNEPVHAVFSNWIFRTLRNGRIQADISKRPGYGVN